MRRHHLLKNFEGFTRVRVGAVLIENENILLVRQKSLFDTTVSQFIPPGGGVNFQETIENAVERECLEETGLKVKSRKLLYIHEFIYQQVHAVEFYFLVEKIDDSLPQKGNDPELSEHDQIIQDVRWISLKNLSDYRFVPQKICDRLYHDYQTGFKQNPVHLK